MIKLKNLIRCTFRTKQNNQQCKLNHTFSKTSKTPEKHQTTIKTKFNMTTEQTRLEPMLGETKTQATQYCPF